MKYLLLIVLISFSLAIQAQEKIYTDTQLDSINAIKYQIAIKPTKVGFYSAILPGLGQGYNKKYWKIPLVYGALATSSYFVISNNNKYHEYRNDYKKKKLGDESILLSLDVLKRAQEYHKKKRDGNILLTLGVYILQIVEASVDAHLHYHNINRDLSFKPKFIKESHAEKPQLVGSFSFQF